MTPRMMLPVLIAVSAVSSLSAYSLRTTDSARDREQSLAPAGSTDAVDVRLITPADGAYVTGPSTLRADINPPARVASVAFFVDGREICRRANAPFECEWDAGAAIVAHHVRLVVTLERGERIVRTVRTATVAFAETVDVDVVQVTATVTDEQGRYVDGLPRSAFRILEDGTPQTISHFYASDAPLELVVALDLSSSMAASLPEMKQAVLAFLRTVPARHRLTLLGFNDTVFTLLPRTAHPIEHEAAIGSLSAWGLTALYEAITRSTEILGSRPGRKAALVFTDGQDQGSLVTLDDAERALQASDLILYMIGQGRGTESQPLKALMDRLSVPTGGRTVSTTSVSAVERSFRDLFEEMSHQYVLGYQSTGGSGDRWREISVNVDARYRVRARQGYRTSRGNTGGFRD